jgi:hypothetical protein
LVQELVGRAEGAGAIVLVGGASDIAESPPFWPVASALRALLRSPRGAEVRQLLAPWSDQLDELVLRSAVPAPLARVQTLELLHRVVLRLATASALLLVVEDVQWADRSTLDLIAYLVANLADERLLLVGTYRTEPGAETTSTATAARTVIRELTRHRQVRSIEVAPLRRDAVAELVRAEAPGRPDLVDLIWNRSAGNAFIAEETLRAALEGDPTGLPSTLRELVLSRVERLSAPALRTVRAVALCEGPLPHRLLETVLDGEPWLLDALREGVDAGVVVVDPAADGYRLRLRHRAGGRVGPRAARGGRPPGSPLVRGGQPGSGGGRRGGGGGGGRPGPRLRRGAPALVARRPARRRGGRGARPAGDLPGTRRRGRAPGRGRRPGRRAARRAARPPRAAGRCRGN